MKETDIQYTICAYLSYKHYFFWRQNSSGSFYTGKDGSRRFRKPPVYAKNGVPDIILIKKGKFIGLEVKGPRGRQSKAQKEFQEGLEEAGGKYHIVRSLEDVQELGL